MVMVFTLVSHSIEWINAFLEEQIRKAAEEAERIKKLKEEADRVSSFCYIFYYIKW